MRIALTSALARKQVADDLGIGMGARAIKRIEKADGLLDSTHSRISKLKPEFEAAGIELIGRPEDGVGIRIRAEPDCGA